MEGQDSRVMIKTWGQVAACEERISLMKKLIRMEMGVAEIEEIGIKINSKFKSFHFNNKIQEGKVVSKDAIKAIMMIKLRDEKKHLKELMTMKNNLRRDLEKKHKKNSRPTRRMLQEFREHSAKVKLEHREKYRVKIEHLRRKYRKEKDEQQKGVPSDMMEFESLKVFNKDKFDEIEMTEYDIKIIGDVDLSENEKKVLKLHPKFAILSRLTRGGLDLDEEIANSKLRMQLSKEIEDKKREEKAKEVIEEKDMLEEIELEARGRQVFDPVKGVYDERKRRVTDLKECNRVTLPKPLPAIEEAKIELRRDIHINIYDKYRNEFCKKNGEQKSNLTREEEDGLKSLEKKVKERKLMVLKTDKSSRFAVCSEEAYLRMGGEHTKKDKVIDRDTIVETEKLLNAHVVAWGKLWNSGDNHEHRGRIVNSKKTLSENTADLYILLKDHKEGEKTRPIVTGCTSNTLGMSNNTASILEAIAASEDKPFESISSEDMLAKMKAFNKKIKIEKEEIITKNEDSCNCADEEESEGKNSLKEEQGGLLWDQESGTQPLVPIPQEPTSVCPRKRRIFDLENYNYKQVGRQTREISSSVSLNAAEVEKDWLYKEVEKEIVEEVLKIDPKLVRTQTSTNNTSAVDLKAAEEEMDQLWDQEEKIGKEEGPKLVGTQTRTAISSAVDPKAAEVEKDQLWDQEEKDSKEEDPKLVRTQTRNANSSTVDLKAAEVETDQLCDQEEKLEYTVRNCGSCGKKKVKEEIMLQERCLIGCDVVALFPSLSSRRTGEIVRERVMKSSLEFEGFDYKQGLRYIILNKHLTGKLDSLRRILPWRRKDGGSNPKMTGTMGSKISNDNAEEHWIFPCKDYSEEEKREIIARCVEIGVRLIFENFSYKFGGETYRQEEGGPIGARVTMAAARLVMQSWSEIYREILVRSGLIVDVLTGYVDDVRQISTCFKPGMRFSKELKMFKYDKESEEEDLRKKSEGESLNQRMARICLQAMNDVSQDLDFTVEVPEDFENERLPTLDFSLWMKDGYITHSYFQKSMKTPYVVMERSAMGYSQLMEILSNELNRRLLKIDHENLEIAEQLKVIEQMTRELKNSGYKIEQSREIVISGVRSWKRKILRSQGSGLYREAHETLEEREKKKLLERETWYLPRREEKEEAGGREERKILRGKRRKKLINVKNQEEKKGLVKAVMFVPYTKGSKLKKELQEAENQLGQSTGVKLKIVERCGIKLVDILTKSNPWKGQDCLREGCLLCQTKAITGKLKTQDCRQRSIVYETRCLSCEEKCKKEIEEKYGEEDDDEERKKAKEEELSKIRLFKYIGETGKSCYERGWQHLSDAAQLKPSSHILKHYLESHEGEKMENLRFGMRIKNTAKSAFERQISESVLIQLESKEHNILNSRSEYNRCALPRLTTKLGEAEFETWKKETLEEKRKEEELEKKIRKMRKERNKNRADEIIIQQLPAMKRRKTSKTQYKTVRQLLLNCKAEKRKENDELVQGDEKKRRVEEDKVEIEIERDHVLEEEEAKDLVDWDKEIMDHEKKLLKEKDEKDDEQTKESKEKSKSWELLNHCVEYLRENDEKLRKGYEKRQKEREKKERLDKAKMKSIESKKRIINRKITELFEKLPPKEKKKLELEDDRKKKEELEVIRKELWSYREPGKKDRRGEKVEKKSDGTILREKMEQMVQLHEKMKEEKAAEERRKKETEERLEKLREKKRLEEIERLRREEEKRLQLAKKKEKEKKWEMAKWIHSYISENTEIWRREREKRLLDNKKILEEWEKKSRLEKVKFLKEKFKNEKGEPSRIEEKKTKELEDDVTWRRWRVGQKRKMELKESDKEQRVKLEDEFDFDFEVEMKKPKLIINEIDDDEDDLDLVGAAERCEKDGGGLVRDQETGEYKTPVCLTPQEPTREEKTKIIEAGTKKATAENDNVDELDDTEALVMAGLVDENFCLDCVMTPCQCLMLKLEMKLNYLKNVKKEEEATNSLKILSPSSSSRLKGMNIEGAGAGGLDIQKLTPNLDINAPPPSQMKILQEIINSTDHPPQDNCKPATCDGVNYHQWVETIISEIILKAVKRATANKSNKPSTKPLIQASLSLYMNSSENLRLTKPNQAQKIMLTQHNQAQAQDKGELLRNREVKAAKIMRENLDIDKKPLEKPTNPPTHHDHNQPTKFRDENKPSNYVMVNGRWIKDTTPSQPYDPPELKKKMFPPILPPSQKPASDNPPPPNLARTSLALAETNQPSQPYDPPEPKKKMFPPILPPSQKPASDNPPPPNLARTCLAQAETNQPTTTSTPPINQLKRKIFGRRLTPTHPTQPADMRKERKNKNKEEKEQTQKDKLKMGDALKRWLVNREEEEKEEKKDSVRKNISKFEKLSKESNKSEAEERNQRGRNKLLGGAGHVVDVTGGQVQGGVAGGHDRPKNVFLMTSLTYLDVLPADLPTNM